MGPVIKRPGPTPAKKNLSCYTDKAAGTGPVCVELISGVCVCEKCRVCFMSESVE